MGCGGEVIQKASSIDNNLYLYGFASFLQAQFKVVRPGSVHLGKNLKEKKLIRESSLDWHSTWLA